VFTVVVSGLIIFAGWVISLYLWPFAPCGKCGGTGRNRGSNGKRHGQCRRCKGASRRTRIGARTVHRGRVSLAERARARKSGKR
jgi:hypothetical protein